MIISMDKPIWLKVAVFGAYHIPNSKEISMKGTLRAAEVNWGLPDERSLRAPFNALQVFRQELGDVLEAGDVFGVDGHQGLMGFEAGTGDLFVRGIDGFGHAGFDVVAEGQRAGFDLEEVEGAEVFEEFRDARGGVDEFNGGATVLGLGIELEAEPGEDAKEGAIHEHAFGEINDKAFIALAV